ncbi:DUF7507 domain-containing protein [Streptomyces sp. NPDC001478]
MSTPPSVPRRVALVNGGFEEPGVGSMEFLNDASQTQDPGRVPGWLTTAPDHKIEVWRDGYLGVPSAEGSQFAELNANYESTLYQDLPTTPGTKLYWRLYHRGRGGEDTMALDIGAPGSQTEQRTITDGNTAWGHYTGTYTVPAGQTLTRFAFRSVSASGGDPTVGNFLDGVFFGTAPHVELSKTAAPAGRAEVGDTLTYRITARNQGGGGAENLTVTDVIPEGTSYVPGSLYIVSGPNAGPKSDETGDDQAHYDPDTGQVVFRLGDGATADRGGSLANTEILPEGSTVEYRVTVDRSAGGTRITNTATATYENRLGGTPEPLTATSEPQITDVEPAADLNVTKAADATTVSVGQTVTYRITIGNAGPNTATGVTVTDELPEGLTFLSADTTSGSYDPAAGVWSAGELDDGATATLTLRAKATRAGQIVNTAAVTADETPLDTADDTDTVTICVEPAPVCCDPCAPQ